MSIIINEIQDLKLFRLEFHTIVYIKEIDSTTSHIIFFNVDKLYRNNNNATSVLTYIIQYYKKLDFKKLMLIIPTNLDKLNQSHVVTFFKKHNFQYDGNNILLLML